jgi:hypothetical protein
MRDNCGPICCAEENQDHREGVDEMVVLEWSRRLGHYGY